MEQTTPQANEPLQAEFIEPVANRKTPSSMSPKKIIIAVVGLSLAVIIGVGLMLVSRTTDPVDEVSMLNLQMANLVTMATEARKNARNPEVSKASVDAATLLIGDAGNLTIVTKGIKAKKDITTSEKASFAPVLSEIKSAGVDGRFDRVFVPLFVERLESTQRQAKIVFRRTSQPALKAAASNTYDHLSTVITTFKAIDTSKL